MRRTAVIWGLVLTAALGGCSSIGDDPSVPSPGEDTAAEEPRSTRGPRASRSPGAEATPSPTASKASRKRKRSRPDGAKPTRPGRERPRDDKQDPTVVAQGPTSSRSDPRADGDSSGERPAYVDIRRASVAGTKRTAIFAIRVEGSVPRPLEDSGSNMTANFRLDMPDGSTHNLYAIGDHREWRGEYDGGPVPGDFSISDDLFVWEIRWNAIGGRSFRWFAQTAWTRSTSGPLGKTDYYFDRVPEFEAAPYPE